MKNFLLLLLSALLSISSLAAGPWSAQAGLGLSSPGSWVPLRLQAPDLGPWSVQVTALSASGRPSPAIVYRHEAGGAFEEPFFLEDATRSLAVRFFLGDLPQEEFALPLEGRLFPGHLIGVDGLSPADAGRLSEVLMPGEPARTLALPPQDWPTSPLSFGGLSALVVRDPGAVLSPAQRGALRAWIASGGRLILVSPRASGSLKGQVGNTVGLGIIASAQPGADWKALLALRPYGEDHRLGTSFAPVARPSPSFQGPATTGVYVFVLGWAGLSTLWLILRKRQGLGRPLALGLFGAAAALVFWCTAPVWERGVDSHGREIALPGDLGRFTVWQALRPDTRQGPFGWPQSPPWSLALWTRNQAGVVQSLGDDRVVLASFSPAVVREARYQVAWEGSALRWFQQAGGAWARREEAPAELLADAPWLASLASEHPGLRWSVGLDGVCWVRPEPEGR